MNLPNHFFADAPDVPVTPELIVESCRHLRRHREKYLAAQPVETLIALLCEVAADWLKPDDKFRRLALEEGPAATGFSRATLARGLDGFFRPFTPENFRALLAQEFGDARRLDGFMADAAGKSSMVVAPELLAHVCAGNLPNPALMSITLGVLLRSAQFVKCASGAALLPRLFAHSICEADMKLGACIEVAEWHGGEAALEEVLFAGADCVTATGGDEALAAIRARLPVMKRFAGYGHRVSFAFVGAEMLSGPGVMQTVSRAADDVTAWDQQGCLSPHVIYAEDKGMVPAEKLAALLAEELARREAIEPRGGISVEEAAAIAARREIYELRAAHDPEATRLWRSGDSTAWTVVFEADARFQMSCLNRFIYVKPVRDMAEALNQADALRGKVSTVGVAASEARAPKLAAELARWGVTRVCPLGQMQNPPLAWRHDGRPALGDLVAWVDFEQ
jgi:hypothetical protein